MSNKVIVNGVDVIKELEKKEKLLDLYREYFRLSFTWKKNASLFNRFFEIQHEIKENDK